MAALRAYVLTCLQTTIRVIRAPGEKAEVVRANLDRSLELATDAVSREGTRLVLFPEAWLQGFVSGRALKEWCQVCLQIPGPETEQMALFCREHGVYLAGAAYEVDEAWPGRFFNTGFVVGPEGKLILKYRQLNPETLNGLLPATSPADIYDAYVAREGKAALFPVADTELGRLACLVGNDINYFEVARSLVLRGAEVLLHPTAEITAASHPAWEDMRRSRAYENVAYLASANYGSLLGGPGPALRSRGHSEIVSAEGKPLAQADAPGEMAIHTTIALNQLRYRRTQIRMNFPAQSKIRMYAATYRKGVGFPNNQWASRPVPSAQEGLSRAEGALQDLQRRGILVEPGL